MFGTFLWVLLLLFNTTRARTHSGPPSTEVRSSAQHNALCVAYVLYVLTVGIDPWPTLTSVSW